MKSTTTTLNRVLTAIALLFAAMANADAADGPNTVVARLWVTPGREAEAVPRFVKVLEFMRKAEPASVFKLYRSERDSSAFVFIETYPSRAALEEHTSTTIPARAKELGPPPAGIFARPPEFEEFRSIEN